MEIQQNVSGVGASYLYALLQRRYWGVYPGAFVNRLLLSGVQSSIGEVINWIITLPLVYTCHFLLLRHIPVAISSVCTLVPIKGNDKSPHCSKLMGQGHPSSGLHVVQKNAIIDPLWLALVAHWVSVFVTALTTAHARVTIRLVLSSSPAFFLLLSAELSEDEHRHSQNQHHQYQRHDVTKNGTILLIALMYAAIGIVLHANNLPWT
jgi:hypothetical protein